MKSGDVNVITEALTDHVVGGVADAVPEFIKIDCYTTFLAEYALIGPDVVLHFFCSKEVDKLARQIKDEYWLNIFPSCLSPVAESYFNATKPRITAQYVPEMVSWYMKCRGFARRLDPEAFIENFLDNLDVSLTSAFPGS